MAYILYTDTNECLPIAPFKWNDFEPEVELFYVINRHARRARDEFDGDITSPSWPRIHPPFPLGSFVGTISFICERCDECFRFWDYRMFCLTPSAVERTERQFGQSEVHLTEYGLCRQCRAVVEVEKAIWETARLLYYTAAERRTDEFLIDLFAGYEGCQMIRRHDAGKRMDVR